MGPTPANYPAELNFRKQSSGGPCSTKPHKSQTLLEDQSQETAEAAGVVDGLKPCSKVPLIGLCRVMYSRDCRHMEGFRFPDFIGPSGTLCNYDE